MRVFAGTALMSLVFSSSPGDARAGIVEVKIEIDEIKCAATIDPSMVVNAKDILVWSFASACQKPQKVLVCAKGDANATHLVPWKDQVGLPTESPAILGTEFGMNGIANVATHVLSNVKAPVASGGSVPVPDKYCVYVVTEIANGLPLQCPKHSCPPSLPTPSPGPGLPSPPPSTRGPELALEVQP